MALAPAVWWIVRDDPSSGRRGETGTRAGVSPAHREVVDQAPERLSWTGQPDTVYRVEVYDVESVPLWTSPRTRESFVVLPVELRDRLEPGGIYYWRVFSETAVEKRRSDLHHFRLAP